MSYPTPLISVVVVNWNRAQLLRSCLRSLANQQQAPNFEVIVVDNGSSDTSLSVIDDFKTDFAFPIKVIANNENLGFCKANNQGIAEARSEWVALLNNDAEARPFWLSAMSSAVKNRADYGMVASKILVYEDPRKIDKVGHLIYPDGQNRGRGSGELDRGQFDRVEDVLWPDGCAAMYRTSMLQSIGGFDEDLFAYGDDAELGMRARLAGWKCVYVPDAVVLHHRGSTLGVLSSRRVELIERNRLLLAVKHFPLSLLWANGFYSAARVTAYALASFRNKGEAARFQGPGEKWRLAAALLRGCFQGLLMIPSTWRKRSQFRSLRRLSPKETRELIFRYKINLKDLAEQAI